MQNNNFSGFLLINKPKDVSSFNCIKMLKKLLPKKIKIGHTGTLDNEATGLLIICIGRAATRLVSSMMNLDKEYQVTAKLGELTDTLDYAGTIIEQKNNFSVSKKDIEQALKNLGSSYLQTPPAYSALKHKGQPLYKLARHKKLTPEALEKITSYKKREIFLHDVQVLDVDMPFFTFRARVSKGTYVRSLANDIAQQLGLPATTYELTRTMIGQCSLNKAIELNKIKNFDDIKNNLLSWDEVKNLLGDFGCGGWI